MLAIDHAALAAFEPCESLHKKRAHSFCGNDPSCCYALRLTLEACALLPDTMRHFSDQPQLLFLRRVADWIASDTRIESALRR